MPTAPLRSIIAGQDQGEQGEDQAQQAAAMACGERGGGERKMDLRRSQYWEIRSRIEANRFLFRAMWPANKRAGIPFDKNMRRCKYGLRSTVKTTRLVSLCNLRGTGRRPSVTWSYSQDCCASLSLVFLAVHLVLSLFVAYPGLLLQPVPIPHRAHALQHCLVAWTLCVVGVAAGVQSWCHDCISSLFLVGL